MEKVRMDHIGPECAQKRAQGNNAPWAECGHAKMADRNACPTKFFDDVSTARRPGERDHKNFVPTVFEPFRQFANDSLGSRRLNFSDKLRDSHMSFEDTYPADVPKLTYI